MKRAEFNAVIKALSTKGCLDTDKIRKLSADDKKRIVSYIVKNRGSIVLELVPDEEEYLSWLHSMGYLYIHNASWGFTFMCTSWGQLQLEKREKELANRKTKKHEKATA